MSWNRKHLLDIESLTADEITTVLDTARAFKAVGERAIKKVPALRGKTVVNLFVEPSTRTRISFELAEQRLSADIINFTAEASSLKKGETLKDTARNLEALNADFIVMRHSASGAPHFLSRVLNASVINAGDGAHEHPTQALLDAFTIRERKGKIAGLNVTILGDILYSRVARSDIWALTKLGARVTLCGPSTLVPKTFEQMGCRVTYDVDEAIRDADIINLLRIQHERQRKTMFPSINEYTSCSDSTRRVWPRPSRMRSSCIPVRSIAAWKLTAKLPTRPLVDPGAGDQRPGRAHGRAFLDQRRQGPAGTDGKLSKPPRLICVLRSPPPFILSPRRGNSCWLIPILRMTVRPIQSHEFSSSGKRFSFSLGRRPG